MSANRGTVSIHKKGRYILPLAENAYAAEILREVYERNKLEIMCNSKYYGITKEFSWNKGKIEIYKFLGVEPKDLPIVSILEQYGLKVNISPTLANYMKKEHRRQVREATALPIPKVDQDIPLLDRCVEGMMVTCTTDFKVASQKAPLFKAGNRYMVTGVGQDGLEGVTFSTAPLGSSVIDSSSTKSYRWSEFDQSLDLYFTDSEQADQTEDVTTLYPDLVAQNRDKLKKRDMPLYEHVFVDACNLSTKRGFMNAYPMRMGKSSSAVGVAELSESKKIMIAAPNNARLMWIRELTRLGFKRGVDFIDINSFEDLNHPAKYHLMTFNWMKGNKDTEAKNRGNWSNLLKPSSRVVKTKDEGSVTVQLTHDCPHCARPLERRVEEAVKDSDGNITGYRNIWTTARGYKCRNKKCNWYSDNSKCKGAAWHKKKSAPIMHTGGYINYELAKIANSEDKKVHGRFDPVAKVADGVWVPPRYKRFDRKYTHVIVDEAHAGKDDSSMVFQAISAMRARRRQVLTGTPIGNSPMDIYWPLHWALRAPSLQFPFALKAGEQEFDLKYCDQQTLEKTVTQAPKNGKEAQVVTKKVRKRIPYLKNPPEFWKLTGPIICRRSYNDTLFREALKKANKFMPQVDPLRVAINMTPEQATLTLEALREFRKAYEEMSKEAKSKNLEVNMTQIQNMGQMVMLRTLATCPEYINQKLGKKVYTGVPGGGKIEQIKKIVKEKTTSGGKVLILSDFKAMQGTVAAALSEYGVIQFDTNWDDDERMEAFNEFMTNPDKKVFVGGTRAVKESVEFSIADTCICCDLLWSPMVQTQAWSRILAPTDRERKCEIVVMMSKDSIDEHIYNIFYGKLVGSEQALDRKSLNRRAKDVDVKWFVDRVLQAADNLESLLGGVEMFNNVSRKIDFAAFEERSI